MVLLGTCPCAILCHGFSVPEVDQFFIIQMSVCMYVNSDPKSLWWVSPPSPLPPRSTTQIKIHFSREKTHDLPKLSWLKSFLVTEKPKPSCLSLTVSSWVGTWNWGCLSTYKSRQFGCGQWYNGNYDNNNKPKFSASFDHCTWS